MYQGMTGGLAFVLDDESWLDNESKSKNPIISYVAGLGKGAIPFEDFVNKEVRCGAAE